MINMTATVIKTLCMKFVALLYIQNEYYDVLKD